MCFHCRDADDEFYNIIRENRHRFSTGVVNSFTSDMQTLKNLLNLDLYIGVNGCSMRDKKTCDVIRAIPLERLMVETNCPYCCVFNSHEGGKYIKTKFPKR